MFSPSPNSARKSTAGKRIMGVIRKKNVRQLPARIARPARASATNRI